MRFTAFLCTFRLSRESEIKPKTILMMSPIISIPIWQYLLTKRVFAANNNRDDAILEIIKHLKLFSTQLAKQRVAINVNKTKSILFLCLRQESSDKYKITLNNLDLSWPNYCKYLGVVLDQGPIFHQHITKTRNKF